MLKYLPLLLFFWAIPASAQNVTCATRAPGDSTNACASTAFVHQAIGVIPTIQQQLDSIGNTRGSILYRGASGWAIRTPGTNGQVLTSQGPGADPTYTSIGNANLGISNVLDFGAVSDCLNDAGTCTDNFTAFTNAIAAAIAGGKNLFIPCGNYFLSAGLQLVNQTDTSYTNPRPSVIGGGARCTFLYYGTGNFDGFQFAGTNGQSNAAISMQNFQGLSLIKTDFLGNGLIAENFAAVHISDVYLTGWTTGLNTQDVQESYFENIYSYGNIGGWISVKGTFTPPNAITCIGCHFSLNGTFGADLQNPAIINFKGGSIEENGYNGGNAWGVRVVYPTGTTDIESNISASFDSVYWERNSGSADILFVNGVAGGAIPSVLSLRDNNFNRAYNAVGHTITSPGGNLIGFNNHGFTAGTAVTFNDVGGTLPGGITAGTTYYVINPTTNNFQISLTVGGSAQTITGGSGTISVQSHTNNVVQISTSNGEQTVLNLNGNGFGGLPRSGTTPVYVPSTSTPYLNIVGATRVCSTGNRYTDYQEVGTMFDACDFADVQFDEATTPTVRKLNNVASITHNGVGDYTLNFAMPALLDALTGSSVTYNTLFATAGNAGYFLVVAQNQTTMHFQSFNTSNTLSDLSAVSIRVLN